MPERKGPSASATGFPVGTVQRGNDGESWVIVATKAGVQRWRRVATRGASEAARPKARKAPTLSATTFNEGTRRKGNNGQTWVVKLARNGVKRWVPVKKK